MENSFQDPSSNAFLETSDQLANDAKRTFLRQLHHHNSWTGVIEFKSLHPLSKQITSSKDSHTLTFLGLKPTPLVSSDSSISLYMVSPLEPSAISTHARDWLEAYQEHGFQTFHEERNCHSFILYDQKRGVLILWRSYESRETIYWYQDAHQFLFSPTMTGLFETGRVSVKPCKEGLAQYLYFGFVPPHVSLVENIHKIAPGQALIYHIEEKKYWHLTTSFQLAPLTGSMKTHAKDPQSSAHHPVLSQLASSLDPLTQLWYLQEPRWDLWLSYRSDENLYALLEDRWQRTFDEFQKHLSAASSTFYRPTCLQKLFIWIELRMKPLGLGKYIHYFLHHSYYRPLNAYCKVLERFSVFKSWIISFHFKGLHQTFCPHIWLQEQLQLPARSLTHEHLPSTYSRSVKRKLLEISLGRAINPMWTYQTPRNWKQSPWPWMSLSHQETLLNRPTLAKKELSEPLSEVLHQDFQELRLAVHQLKQSLLIDEGIVSSHEIARLAKAMDEQMHPPSSDSRLFRQASTLVALELWLKIFIDQQGRLSPENSSWQKLLDLPTPYL